MADTDDDTPMTPSGDYRAMSDFWEMVDAILGGAEAMRATSGARTIYSVPGPHQPVAQLRDLNRGALSFPQSPYLPAFPNETYADYSSRLKWAPFTNIYEDIADNLAAKPFSKECELDQREGDDLKKLAEDIDGQGNSLHVFARGLFRRGLDYGVDWILVDHTRVMEGATLAQERAMGARPYWVHIDAKRMLAVYSTFLNGAETIYHARIHEPLTRRRGYGEETVDRVRALDRQATIDEATGEIIALGPATWTVYEAQKTKDQDKIDWIMVGTGALTIGVIPLVPFIPVGRDGSSWRVKPAFHDIAHMQVEEFQQESNLKTIKELVAFPILSGNGVTPPTDATGEPVTVAVGPRAVLFAPMGGDGRFGNWQFIEPTAASLTFLQADLEKHRTEMRNLGRQPLASANLTVITTANVSMKAHSAVQAWALLLKDALEQAWVFTCKWLKQDHSPIVNVYTDFGVDFEAGTELDFLAKAQAQGILSKKTVRGEAKRRGVLSDDFDDDEEEQQLAEEEQGLAAEEAIDPVTGEIVEPTTRPQKLTNTSGQPPAAPADNVIPMRPKPAVSAKQKAGAFRAGVRGQGNGG